MRFRKNKVVIGGQSFFYWENDSNNNETVVLLHGFPGNHAGLLHLAEHLDSRYKIIIPDLPACGASDSLKDQHSLKNFAGWLDIFLETIGVAEVIVVGHSFGARVALAFNFYHTSRVAKLILITPVSKMDGFIPKVASLKGTIAKLLPAGLQKAWLSNGFYQALAYMIVFKSANYKTRQHISAMDKKELGRLDPKATLEIFDEFYHTDLTVLARKIRAKTLIIAGSKDEIATLASVKRLATYNKNISLEIMEKAGHLLPLERPVEAAGIISNWLIL